MLPLELFYLIAQPIYAFLRKQILFSPFGVIEDIAVQKHHKALHLNTSDLFGKNGETPVFQFTVCHRHIS